MEHSKLGLIWFMNNTEISYDLHLIIIQIRPGFHIYILERSFCLLLYTITMIQHYSRCVIRQLLWLWFINTTCVVLTRFFNMSSLQELCANCLISDAPTRSASRSPQTYHARIPWQRTTSPPTEAQKHRAIFMYTAFPRDLYSAECHTCICATLCPCIVQLYVHVLCNFMSMYCATLCPYIVQPSVDPERGKGISCF